MSEERFEHVVLSKITPHPDNPRKQFDGPEFDELVESIKQKGVIVPVILRPLASKKKKDPPYQLVAGERRWRARMKAAEQNGGPEKATIPAIIRELTNMEEPTRDDVFRAIFFLQVVLEDYKPVTDNIKELKANAERVLDWAEGIFAAQEEVPKEVHDRLVEKAMEIVRRKLEKRGRS